MKKVRAALGFMACVAAGGAMAQTSVSVSGLVDVFAGSLKKSGEAGRTAAVNSGGMTTSWWGFKGTEDLGGGLRAEFALTGFFRADSGAMGRFNTDNLFSRDANVGLAGSFGKVQLGRGLAPQFLPTVLFNPFGDSFTFSPLVVQANVSSGGTPSWANANAADTGWSNQIIYTTPKFGGVTANLHYQFGEVAGDTGVNNVGANLLYFSGPVGLTAFYHDAELSNPNSTVSPNRQKTAFVGGSYDLKVVKLFATYQRNKNESATTGAEVSTDKVGSLGLSAPAGNGSVLLGYAHTKRDFTAAADAKRQTYSIGYDYFLSRRTDVYAIAMGDKITGAEREASFGLGVRHRF